MLEEADMSKASRRDPSTNLHRPESLKSQDICHVLASAFKDLYARDIIGKDALSNLVKTNKGRSGYHDRYVEELQQAHAEYSRCVEEADMLEDHIIRARARAAETESRAWERMRETVGETVGEGADLQGLPPVKSAFSWCVDSDLLKTYNLIAPEDYLTTQRPQVEAPAPVKHDPAKPTIAYTLRTSREPRDDGCAAAFTTETDESDLGLTLESSSDAPKGRKTQREILNQTKARPKWRDEPSAKDRAEGLEDLRRLRDRGGFLCNPRFLPPHAQQGGTSLVRPKTRAAAMEPAGVEPARGGTEEPSSTEAPAPVFKANPPVVAFTDYRKGQVYETMLELINVTSASRHVRVLPPTTPYFSVGLGRFPGEGGVVAPGLSCKYPVRFAPDSLGDYEDFVVVETQVEDQLVVPVVAKRPPPVLTLPRVLDCGCCLVGGVKFVEFPCKNVGLSAGTFCVVPKKQWPASNLRSLARMCYSEEPPFAVAPPFFLLQPGEAVVVEVVFFPTAAERSRQVFTVVCDNCQVKDFSIEGVGQAIALELVSGETEPPVAGEARDLTAEHFVRVGPCNPHSVQQRKITVRSNVHLELPFHWQIMKPNLRPLLPGETPEPSHIQFRRATDDVFHVSPASGVLGACREEEFLLAFCPKELKDYHSVCHLVLRDVPQLPPEPSDDGILQPVRAGSKVSDVIVMEIEAKGSTEPYQVLLEPYAVVIPGEIYIRTTTRRQFKMWNHSKTSIFFQWERWTGSCHIIEVLPPTGRIEENECFDFDLIVTGGKPERVVTTLDCLIEHHHEPVTLAVEVSFKGPVVTLSVPGVDFGLMTPGQRTQASLLLTNITQLEASWALQERRGHKDTQISMEPSSGVLPPLASCSVTVLFAPRLCRPYETELELTVEDGAGSQLSVRADVQSPRVCLLNCELLLSDLYVGVPATATVTLFNQTPLASHFSWMPQLQGRNAGLCAASFEPTRGTLGPNTSAEIAVNFVSHTDTELSEVVAVCEVRGMNLPLVLNIRASNAKQLSVSYSLPGVSSTPGDQSLPTLDFGEVALTRAATRRLLITNRTAIPAAFAVGAEYFGCRASPPSDRSDERSTWAERPLPSGRAGNLEEKARRDFVSGLLARGRGAAFLASPDAGTLGPFQTQTVDVTAYNDMWGEYRDRLVCKVGELEATLIPLKMTVKGCPIYFQMTGPRPDRQNQGPFIQFGTHLSGGDTVSRSLRINNPTMFDIRVDWETYNVDPGDRKLVDVVVAYGDAFPVKDADAGEASSGALRISDGNARTARERNGTPGSEGTSSSLRSATDGEEYKSGGVCEEEDDSRYPSSTKKKLFSVHVRPHMGNLSDYPYCITPQQIVLPAKGSGTIHVSFTPLSLSGSACKSRCVGFALGFLSLDSEMAACVPGKVARAQGLDLEPIRMDLLAVVKSAVLSVQMEEDEEALEFRASAGDLLRGDSEKPVVEEFDVTQTLQLRNNLEVPLCFRLGTRPPFLVLKPRPRARTSGSADPAAGDRQPLVLQPQRSMQVKVAFRCSMSLLDYENEGAPPGATPIHGTGGQRRLRFQQNLLIHYSNNSQQTVPLRADLDLAAIHLSTDSVDFGLCYVGQTQTREVRLCSLGAHTYWQALIDPLEGDSHVFTMTPGFGLLRTKELHVTGCSQCLQISFTPSGDREFRATAVIRSPLVKTPLALQLQGTGSFDGSVRV